MKVTKRKTGGKIVKDPYGGDKTSGPGGTTMPETDKPVKKKMGGKVKRGKC